MNDDAPGKYTSVPRHAIARCELAQVKRRLFIDGEFRDFANGGECVDSILSCTQQKSAWLRQSE